jgi:MraZ protein
MAFFIGEFEQTIDPKRRLAISSGLRELSDPEEDGRNFILVLGPDRHLWLYPDRYYQRLIGTMKRSPLPSRQQRGLDLLFAMARLLKADSQGRVVLPEKSMQRAVTAERVVLVGNNDHIEVWPEDEWNSRTDQDLSSYGEMLYEAADRLSGENAADK